MGAAAAPRSVARLVGTCFPVALYLGKRGAGNMALRPEGTLGGTLPCGHWVSQKELLWAGAHWAHLPSQVYLLPEPPAPQMSPHGNLRAAPRIFTRGPRLRPQEHVFQESPLLSPLHPSHLWATSVPSTATVTAVLPRRWRVWEEGPGAYPGSSRQFRG